MFDTSQAFPYANYNILIGEECLKHARDISMYFDLKAEIFTSTSIEPLLRYIYETFNRKR